jgi:hypothetical protein
VYVHAYAYVEVDETNGKQQSAFVATTSFQLAPRRSAWVTSRRGLCPLSPSKRIRKRVRVRNDNEKTCDPVRSTQTNALALALANPFWR